MCGITSTEKVSQLLGGALVSLNITRNKQKWFREFVAFFSVEATYKELADRLMETYRSGKDCMIEMLKSAHDECKCYTAAPQSAVSSSTQEEELGKSLTIYTSANYERCYYRYHTVR